MNIDALISDLKRRGFQLTPRGDKLAVAPASKLTPELTALLKAHKSEILRSLRMAHVTKQEYTVVHHTDPDPCPRCGQRVWWINPQYIPVCHTCHPSSTADHVKEWLKPQGL